MTATETEFWAGSPVYAKYGEAAVAGFQAVPDLLLKHQDTLGLSPTNLVVLLNVLMHWWYPDQKPFPRSTTIARRMGLSPRAVQRSLQKLQRLGLLTREPSEDGPTYFDPEPLVTKLVELAKDDIDYLVRRRGRQRRELRNREGELGSKPTPPGPRSGDALLALHQLGGWITRPISWPRCFGAGAYSLLSHFVLKYTICSLSQKPAGNPAEGVCDLIPVVGLAAVEGSA